MFNFFRKKKISNIKIDNIYNQHLYTGLNGILMRYCHRNLEKTFPKIKCKKVLEIGAGSEPHYEYLENKDLKYFILELKGQRKKINKKFIYKFYNGKNIPFKDKEFDRIILSHTLEHIPSPEEFLNQVAKKVRKGGIISISLPTDPAVMWRVGRLFNKLFKIKKSLNTSSLEYDYMNSIEHINSFFNLYNIINYNFKGKLKDDFLPFKINLPDLNLFYNVHLTK